jgi:hypothetical protein
MHVDITTTLSLKDDDGKEITRTVHKGRTLSFEATSETPMSTRLAAAMNFTKRHAVAAIEAVAAELRG